MGRRNVIWSVPGQNIPVGLILWTHFLPFYSTSNLCQDNPGKGENTLKGPYKLVGQTPVMALKTVIFHKESPQIPTESKRPQKLLQKASLGANKNQQALCQIQPFRGVEKVPRTSRKFPGKASKTCPRNSLTPAVSASMAQAPLLLPPSGGIFYAIFTHNPHILCYNTLCTLAAYER